MKQRMAFRRAILEGKTTGNLADAFNPSTAVIDAINSQVEEEVTNGLIPEKERDMRVVELMERRRAELLPGIIEEGRRAAEDWTFNSEPKGLIGYLLHGVTSDINRKTKVGGYLFSFMRTAANVLNAAIDYSPYGILRAYNFSAGDKLLPNTSKYSRQADGEAFTRGSQEFYTEISKATLGAAAIFALAAAMAKGLEEEEEGKIPWFAIYGNGPRTSMERRQLQQGIGWQANSIKIGDNVLRFSEWPALGYALGGLGTLADAIRFKTAGDVPNEEKVMLWSLGMVSTILDRNLLQGVSALFGAIANPNAQGISKLKQLGGGIVSGYSNPQALKFLRASTDIEDNGMVKVLEQGSTHGWLMSMLPMSAGYDKAAQNVFGEDVEEFPWSPLTKRFGMADTVQRHPILSPLVAKGLMVPLPSKNTEIVVNGKAIPLSRNNDIYRAFVKYRGDALKKRLTPTMITRLTTMDKDRAEDLLKGSINSAVREYAVAKIKQDIRNGTLKPDFTKEKER